jgi:hypothetical protein
LPYISARERILVRPDPKEYLAQVIEATETQVALRIELKGRDAVFSLPKEMCPEEACVPGGSFYLLAQGVDPEEERELLADLLGDAGKL